MRSPVGRFCHRECKFLQSDQHRQRPRLQRIRKPVSGHQKTNAIRSSRDKIQRLIHGTRSSPVQVDDIAHVRMSRQTANVQAHITHVHRPRPELPRCPQNRLCCTQLAAGKPTVQSHIHHAHRRVDQTHRFDCHIGGQKLRHSGLRDYRISQQRILPPCPHARNERRRDRHRRGGPAKPTRQFVETSHETSPIDVILSCRSTAEAVRMQCGIPSAAAHAPMAKEPLQQRLLLQQPAQHGPPAHSKWHSYMGNYQIRTS